MSEVFGRELLSARIHEHQRRLPGIRRLARLRRSCPPAQLKKRRLIVQRQPFHLRVSRNPLQILAGQRVNRRFLRFSDPRNLDLHGSMSFTCSPTRILLMPRTRCSPHEHTAGPRRAPPHESAATYFPALDPTSDETAPTRPAPAPTRPPASRARSTARYVFLRSIRGSLPFATLPKGFPALQNKTDRDLPELTATHPRACALCPSWTANKAVRRDPMPE